MCSTKRIQKAAQKFRRENQDLYNQCLTALYRKALMIRKYGSDNQS